MATVPRFTLMREDVSVVFAREYGETRDSTTIMQALLAIGSAQRTLILSDDDGGVWTLTTDVTIPVNVTLSIPAGVSTTGPGNLLIEGGLVALRTTWFQGTGTLTWLGGLAQFRVNSLRSGPTQLSALTLDTPLPVSEGGTDARTPADARVNLGIVPGTDVQPYDATLTALAAQTTGANLLSYFTGVDAVLTTPLSPYSRTLLDDPDAASWRNTLELGALAPLSMITTPYLTDKHVTLAKIQDLTNNRLLGRSAGSDGVPQLITIGAGLVLSAGELALAGGILSGAGVANRVSVWDSAGSLTSDAKLLYNLSTDFFSVDSPTLVVDGVQHYVGIGQATPATPLELLDTRSQGAGASGNYAATVTVLQRHALTAASQFGHYGLQIDQQINQGSFATTSPTGVHGINVASVVTGSSGRMSRLVGVRVGLQNMGNGPVTQAFGFLADGYFGPGPMAELYSAVYVANAATSPTNGLVCGLQGEMADGTNRYNLYLSGTAPNYLKGLVGINMLPTGAYNLDVTGTARVYTSPQGYSVVMSTGSVTTTDGYYVSNTAGRSINAFASALDNATGHWNIYCSGNAPSYMAGPLRLGVLGAAANYILMAQGDARINGALAVNMDAPAPWACAINDRLYIVSYLAIASTSPSYGFHCNTNAGTPGGAWVNSSSRLEFKTDVQPLTGALATLLSLQGRTWRWSSLDLETLLPGRQVGLIVEEVAPVLPYWISKDGEDRENLAERGLSAYVIEAFREVVAMVESLTQRVDALETA